jgi:hypothetical protein
MSINSHYYQLHMFVWLAFAMLFVLKPLTLDALLLSVLRDVNLNRCNQYQANSFLANVKRFAETIEAQT